MPQLIATILLFAAAVATRNTKRRWLDTVSRICAGGCAFGIVSMLMH